ncbi:hypothetical protein [Actinospica robiniae]|uniref:hypothetical protein n=1 Tax=Actinospica robiniae TaxID=304901 RepID=UPI0003F74345|nr:hypothetical protein [Actinospica robiniae]
MDTTLIPDDLPVTVTWNTVTTTEHSLTLPYGELREEIGRLRARHGRPPDPDLAGDLDLLEQNWLGAHESDGAPSDFERSVTSHNLPPLPTLPSYTVSLDDSDEETPCPHTYVLHAPNLATAVALALTRFAEEFPNDYLRPGTGPSVLDGGWWTFPGTPSWPSELSGRTWEDLRADEHLLDAAYRQAADS